MTEQHHSFLYSHLALIIIPAPAEREVGHAVLDDDYGSPFFLSYSHTRGNSSAARDTRRLFEKFFHDLAENVGELISPPTGVPAGFMDREMGGGMQWTDELMHAVGTCHNLVALLSPRYLKSEWCGKEWDGFARRAVRKLEGAKASPRQGCIIPVRWVPFPTVLPHPVSTRLVYSPTRDLDPLAPTHYEQNGILGLLKVSNLKKCYEVVTWQLAMHIADIYHSQRTEVRLFDPAELNNAFRE